MLQALLAQIDDAVRGPLSEVESRIGELLREASKSLESALDANLLRPCEDGYTRRLVYVDPDQRYSVMAMTWKPGQRTKLHDHDGLWVVESVLRGELTVDDYDHDGVDGSLHQFRLAHTLSLKPGEFGSRMPPKEHHVVKNLSSKDTVSIHVFGGLMERCCVFEPARGGYERRPKRLCVTP